MFDIKSFSERLKSARTKKGLSQADLAKAVGVSAATISSYETANGAKIPALDKAAVIAETLSVSLDWLCGLEAETPKKLDGIVLLDQLSEVVSTLNMTAFITQKEFGSDETLELICSDNDIIAFFREREKIIPILNDESIDDYLKDGLKKALYNKFKNFTIHKEFPF